MRIYISADIEGIAGVVTREHTRPEGFEYQSARIWMTDSVAAAANAAFAAGASEVVISDSHGNAQNLLLDRLPRAVQVVRSWPRPLSMMQGMESGDYAGGYFHEPTIFVDVAPTMRIAREEIFGPVVSVMRCGSLDEAIDIANGVEYGLSASIYTQDINRAFQAMRDLYTGIFYVNAPTIGAEVHLPFGGTKNTGNGHREAGVAALEVFSEWKSIYIDFSGRLQRAQIDVEQI